MQLFSEVISFNSTLVIQLINTLILCLLLSKFLVKPVREFIQKRQDSIQESLDNAEQKNAQALTLKGEYEEKLEEIKRDGRDIITTAKQRAEEQSKEIIDNAYDQTDEIKRQAQEEIEKAKLKSVNEAKQEIISLAMMIAEKIIEKELDEKEQRKMVDKIIAEVGNENIRING